MSLSSEEIESWKEKITLVWEPMRPLLIRLRPNGLGVLFIAELLPNLSLHLGVKCGVDMCALWRDDEYVLWDCLLGFCPSLQPHQTLEDRQSANTFAEMMKPLIRRNCFSLGCHVESTDEERREWQWWLSEQTKHTRHFKNQRLVRTVAHSQSLETRTKLKRNPEKEFSA